MRARRNGTPIASPPIRIVAVQSAAPSSTARAFSQAEGFTYKKGYSITVISQAHHAPFSGECSARRRHLSDHVGIALIEAGWRRRVTGARVGHFATSDGKRPALVPVCFVLRGDTVYHAIDAKPKTGNPRRLRRVRNVEANPAAAFLVDAYVEDWRRLWYALFFGRARIIERGPEHDRAVAALRRKYRQYRSTLPLRPDALVIALDVRRLSHWQASSPVRRPARGRARRP
jgi:PPOX class probable F420-dependent enzyme